MKPPPAGSSGPTFAVAFGGGGARGLAHIHAIEVLDELGIKPVAIAGSSIGAIMGAGMAAGMSGININHYVRTILGNSGEVARRIWHSRPGTLREAMSNGFRMGQFDLTRILTSFLPEAIPETFEGLEIPLKVTGTDYYGHCLAVLETGELVPALAASASIPALFRPIEIDGRLLIDGGIYNPVPFDLLEGLADIVIAIDVSGTPRGNGNTPSAIDLMFGSNQLMMQSINDWKLSIKRPQIYLHPPVAEFRVLDFLKVDEVMEQTAPLRDQLKRAVDEAVKELA